MRRPSWTDADLIQAVGEARSIAGVLRILGLAPYGGNHERIRLRLRELAVDTSHFTGSAWSRGLTGLPSPASAKPLEQVLVNGVFVNNTDKLRRRLIKAGLLQALCARCGIIEWLGLPAPLELDHIDGSRLNNELSNLRLLCPNCHAQTETYRGKNISRREPSARLRLRLLRQAQPSPIVPRPARACSACGGAVSRRAQRCKRCDGVLRDRPTKAEWPTASVLAAMVVNSSKSAVARQLGVSEAAVRKHLAQVAQLGDAADLKPA